MAEDFRSWLQLTIVLIINIKSKLFLRILCTPIINVMQDEAGLCLTITIHIVVLEFT